jgi:transposase InsO family protein
VIVHSVRQYSVKALCAYFGVSRAAYYAWLGQMSQVDKDEERMRWVQEAYLASHRIYGYRRIKLWLSLKRGLNLNHKAILRLMNKLGIHSIARRRRPYPKMEQLDSFHRYPNVLARNFVASQPNQKWVTDVTFIRTRQGWAYLSTIKDLYDGFIVAYQVSSNNSIHLVTNTLKQARQKEQITKELILHSDQGYQYSSSLYFDLTRQYHITPSMSRRGNCWDNAPMENFFGHLKEEYLRHVHNPTFDQVRQLIDEYIYFYNHERIQLKTRQTPYEMRCLSS